MLLYQDHLLVYQKYSLMELMKDKVVMVVGILVVMMIVGLVEDILVVVMHLMDSYQTSV